MQRIKERLLFLPGRQCKGLKKDSSLCQTANAKERLLSRPGRQCKGKTPLPARPPMQRIKEKFLSCQAANAKERLLSLPGRQRKGLKKDCSPCQSAIANVLWTMGNYSCLNCNCFIPDTLIYINIYIILYVQVA